MGRRVPLPPMPRDEGRRRAFLELERRELVWDEVLVWVWMVVNVGLWVGVAVGLWVVVKGG